MLLKIKTIKRIFLTIRILYNIMEKMKKQNTEANNNMNDSFFIVPPEIDTHLQVYGKYVWEVTYHDRCPLCEKRMDEFGFCACNGCGE